MNYPDFVDSTNISVDNFGYSSDNFRFLLKVPFKTNGHNFLRVIMKNPSTASEKCCDNTKIKVCNAAKEAEYDGIIIINLFPFRSKEASNIYSKFYIENSLYKETMQLNKEIIKSVCTNADVVFAWGTNTIKKNKSFNEVYNNVANDVVDIIMSCTSNIHTPHITKQGMHSIHGLRWWRTILVENDCFSTNTIIDEKHLVLHHNMFGPSAEVCNTNPNDLTIYCYKENEILSPNCENCEYFRGTDNNLGVICEWNDFDGNLSRNERVIQNSEKTLEYDRVQYAKTCTRKKDLDEYMDWIINYEK